MLAKQNHLFNFRGIDDVLEENLKLKEEVQWLNDVIANNISDLAEQIALVRTEHSEDIASLRTEHSEDIVSVRTDLADEISSVRTEHSGDIKSVREEITSVKTELKQDVSSLRTDIVSLKFGRQHAFLNFLIFSYILICFYRMKGFFNHHMMKKF